MKKYLQMRKAAIEFRQWRQKNMDSLCCFSLHTLDIPQSTRLADGLGGGFPFLSDTPQNWFSRCRFCGTRHMHLYWEIIPQIGFCVNRSGTASRFRNAKFTKCSFYGSSGERFCIWMHREVFLLRIPVQFCRLLFGEKMCYTKYIEWHEVRKSGFFQTYALFAYLNIVKQRVARRHKSSFRVTRILYFWR